jgi:hypothetical protein
MKIITLFVDIAAPEILEDESYNDPAADIIHKR